MIDPNMTLEQIEQQMAALQAAADARRQAEKAEVITAVRELCATHKLQVRDIFPPKAKAASTVAAKYRDPQNAENTWTGRGKMPRWLAAYVAQGYGVDSFLIAAPSAPADPEAADEIEDDAEYAAL